MNRHLKIREMKSCSLKMNLLMNSCCLHLSNLRYRMMTIFLPRNSCCLRNGKKKIRSILIRFQYFFVKALNRYSGCCMRVQTLTVLKSKKMNWFFAYFWKFRDMLNVAYLYCCLSCYYYMTVWYWFSDYCSWVYMTCLRCCIPVWM